MKHTIITTCMCTLFLAASAQEFRGYVQRADSLSTPVFQAKAEVFDGDQFYNSFKTYFDGSFKFTTAKSKTYTVKISYSGYTDTTFTFSTDKKGVPLIQSVTVKLKKDGMRLLGIIRSSEEKFPINEATVVLKNVMTREESRITTGIDGAYNFKLDYETNYRLTLDKRSTGIINKYRDTTFYISTVGFNLPLDYKLDVYLESAEEGNTTIREGYDPTKQPANKNLKPVVTIKGTNSPESQNRKPTTQEISNSVVEDSIVTIEVIQPTQQPAAIKEVNSKPKATIQQQQKVIETTTNKSKRKKETNQIEVEIIRDNEGTNANDKKPKLTTTNILDTLQPKTGETRKADDMLKIETTDTTIAIKTSKPNTTNILSDSTVYRTKTNVDSVLTAPVIKTPKPEEKVYKPKTQEELIQAAELYKTRQKALQDSIERTKAVLKNNPK